MNRALVMVVAQPAELAGFDPDARLERACELVVDAGQAGARWIIFPEAYLPGVPAWCWSVPHDDPIIGGWHALVLAAAVMIPGAISNRLCRIAQRSRVGVVIGLIEHDSGSYYNSLLCIDAHGCIRGHYRTQLSASSWSLAATAPMQQEQADVRQAWAGGI